MNYDSLFVNYYVYKNNIYCHTEEKPDECDMCDEAFVNSIIITNDKNTKMCDLNGNHNSHNEEKSPKCTVYYKVLIHCVSHYAFKFTIFSYNIEKPTDYLFVNYYAYKNTIFCHTEEKPTECDTYDKVCAKSLIISNDKNITMCDVNTMCYVNSIDNFILYPYQAFYHGVLCHLFRMFDAHKVCSILRVYLPFTCTECGNIHPATYTRHCDVEIMFTLSILHHVISYIVLIMIFTIHGG